jgi:hypothetical protein
LSLYSQIAEIGAFDCHTHIDAAHPVARGIHDILLYHMVISDLYSAGCPDGSRLSEDPDAGEVERRIEGALPYLPRIANTSCYYAMALILKELFDWDEPVTIKNWWRLDEVIKARSAREGRLGQIMAQGNIVMSNTELWRGRDGALDEVFTYSMEWSFFTRAQWGRHDTALIELEHAWNHDAPCPPLPVTLTEGEADFPKKIRTLDDVEEALAHYLEKTPFGKIMAIASHFSCEINYGGVSAPQMAEALSRRGRSTPKERDIYANYIFNRYLELYESGGYPAVLQFSTGAEPLPFETGSRMDSKTVFELARIFAAHPKIKFNLHVSNMAQNQAFCTLARELPNVSLNGYWWHNFFPSFIPRVLSERLDMLAVSKVVGFFSDAYTMEWAYAKQRFIRVFTADVLAEKIAMGQYTEPQALDIARWLFRGSAEEIFDVRV